jgi:hypothetical protein
VDCDFCHGPGALKCATYYPEKGREEPHDGHLCADCHHGGAKQESDLTRTRETATGRTIRIVDVPVISDG